MSARIPTYCAGDAVLAGNDGVPAFVLVDLNGNVAASGGTSTVAAAAGTSANTVVKASAGRLCRVLITAVATGTATLSIYDNAGTNSGTVIGAIPFTTSTPAVGTVFDFEMPAISGITVGGASTNPGITVSYY